MAVFLEYVEINDDKINELIKKKIIIKSAVSVKEECLREDILCCYNIICDYEMTNNLSAN